jgi:membrane protease subunit HflK
MAWNPKGGPWGGGGGPWGGGPSSPPPPDVEEMLKRTQERVRRLLPSRFGGGRGVVLLIAAVAAVWLASGFYRVQPGEQGIELLFGRFVKITSPGLNYWFPGPVGEVIKTNVERTNQITIGFRSASEFDRTGGTRDIPRESLMLTADQNIIDVDFVVQWRIKDAASYRFNIRDPEATVKIAAESAIREVMGQTLLEDALTIKRQEVDQRTKELLQAVLDSYHSGVVIAEVKQLKVDPPSEVIDAFNDVQRARQDKERSVNEALAYRNDIVPRAKGEAERIIQQALANKEKLTREAEGEAKRFLSVFDAYKLGEQVTTRRLYLERLQQVLSSTGTVIIDPNGTSPGVVPYLALPELQKRQPGAGQ